MKFDTEKRDAQGRPLGWALALMEMLADPMLLAWVPGWVVEQYERWNPYFRPCVRSALQQYKMKSGKAVLDATTKARVPNPHFLRQPHTNKNFLWTVRQRMMHRYKVHKDDPDLSRPDADKEGASDDDDGSDPDKGPASDGSADEGPAEAARRLREEIEIVRDERPSADGVEQLEPGVGNEWDRQTLEQRLSAAHSAPAAADVSVNVGGTFADGVSVNPRYDWQSLPDTVSAGYENAFKRQWAEWKQSGGIAQGDGMERDELDVWGKFAYDIVEQKALDRATWQAGGKLCRRQTRPLRLVLSGGAGSGKSTTVRAIVRAQRERKTRTLGGARAVRRDGKQQQVKLSCVLSAPTGTASFQMKYGATTAHRAWGVPI